MTSASSRGSVVELASAEDEGKLLMWDTRQAQRAVAAIQAEGRGREILSVAWGIHDPMLIAAGAPGLLCLELNTDLSTPCTLYLNGQKLIRDISACSFGARICPVTAAKVAILCQVRLWRLSYPSVLVGLGYLHSGFLPAQSLSTDVHCYVCRTDDLRTYKVGCELARAPPAPLS